VQAWTLLPDGTFRRLKPGSQRARAAQEILLARLCGSSPARDAARKEKGDLSSRAGKRARARREAEAEALQPLPAPVPLRRRAQ